jgi:hypothetical protein
MLTVSVARGDSDVDRARTILWNNSTSSSPISSGGFSWEYDAQINDIRLASVLVLSVTLAVAAASAMITGVTGVLDRRQTLSLLRLAGTPLRVLDGARMRETLVPFVVLGAGAVAAGMFCALPLAVSAEVTSDQRSLTTLLIPVTVAVVGLTLAEVASRITLRAATSDPNVKRM